MSEQLPPAFDELRDQLREAAVRDNEIEDRVAQRVRHGRRRQWLLVTVGALVTFGGVAVADRAIDHRGPDQPADIVPRDETAAADPGTVTDTAVPDPAGGPKWALRVFTNPAGQDCVVLGRLLDGRLGTYDQTRTFRPYPAKVSGSCQPLDRDGLLVAGQFFPLSPARTVIYGISRDRQPVRVTLAGVTHTVKPGGQGTFIDLREGLVDRKGGRVTTAVDGRTTTRRLG